MKTVCLTDVCEFQGGTQPPKNEWSNSLEVGFIRMLQIRDFTQSERTTPEYVKDKPQLKRCNSDDILIGRYGASIGKILTGLCGAYNVALVKTIPNPNALTKEFLLYLLKGPDFQNFILGIGSRAAQAGFNQSDLSQFSFALPPLQDQIRIAHLLEKVEGLIAKRKEDLAKLDVFLKSVFLEMFGDPVRNEKGWEKQKISSAACLQGGYAFKSADILEEGKVKLVKISNVHVEKLQWSEIAYLPEEFLDKYSDYSLNAGDLLIALTRPIIKSLNAVKTATVRSIDLPCMVNQRVGRFKLNPSKLNSAFLREFCSTQYFKNEVDKLCSEALQPNVSTSQIEAIEAFFPPLDLQNKFAAIVERVESLKAQYQKSLTDLESLYGTLSQKAFAGELDLERVKV